MLHFYSQMIEYENTWDDKLDGKINLGYGVSKKRFTTSIPYPTCIC